MIPAPDHDRRNEALADLARLRREGDALGGFFGRARDHFGGADAPKADAIEIWGRRIGRLLSLAALIALAVHLYSTYVR